MSYPAFAYFQGSIVSYSEARVSVLTHGLNYGTAVFGGLRGYWNPDHNQLYIFRPGDHYRRFLESTRLMRFHFEYTVESLVQITRELLIKEGYRQDVYIRPLAYKADEIIGVKLDGLIDELSIVSLPFDKYVANDTNAHVTISSWRRVDDNTIPARGKISGAYANSALIKSDALRAGFDEALVLTNEGHISEASAMNVFMLRNGALITPPITENILEGITRRTVIELAQRELGIQVVERPIDRSEAYLCDELFLAGTAAQITAVTRVDFNPVGQGVMGPVTAQLRSLFLDVVRAKCPPYSAWTFPVY